MFEVRGLVCGLVAAVIGVVIWATVAYVWGIEWGWIAWLVGAVIGGAMAIGGEDEASMGRGLAAAGIAIVAVFVGKFTAVYMVAGDVLEEMAQEMVTEEFAISVLADEVVEEVESSGRLVFWPDGVDPDYAMYEEDYPEEIWAEAVQTWELWTPQEQDQHMEWVRYNTQQYAQSIRGDVAGEAFEHYFGPHDILWFALATITAFGAAARWSSD